MEQENIFSESAVQTIFNGLVLPNQTKAIGYRLENQTSKTCLIYARSPKDSFGCYSARGFVHGIKRTGKRNKVYFFPRTWTQEQVTQAIIEAYENRQQKNINFISGETVNGLQIQLWLDENGKVYDAMPLIKRDLEQSEKRNKVKKRNCSICGKPKHKVCVTHNNIPRPKVHSFIWKRIKFHTRKFYFDAFRLYESVTSKVL
jgi:Bacterial EndoU nuclease